MTKMLIFGFYNLTDTGSGEQIECPLSETLPDVYMCLGQYDIGYFYLAYLLVADVLKCVGQVWHEPSSFGPHGERVGQSSRATIQRAEMHSNSSRQSNARTLLKVCCRCWKMKEIFVAHLCCIIPGSKPRTGKLPATVAVTNRALHIDVP